MHTEPNRWALAPGRAGLGAWRARPGRPCQTPCTWASPLGSAPRRMRPRACRRRLAVETPCESAPPSAAAPRGPAGCCGSSQGSPRPTSWRWPRSGCSVCGDRSPRCPWCPQATEGCSQRGCPSRRRWARRRPGGPSWSRAGGRPGRWTGQGRRAIAARRAAAGGSSSGRPCCRSGPGPSAAPPRAPRSPCARPARGCEPRASRR
mmetsp:Transcript_160098/g.489679  ORF Transcript_160098/g.489679 Transcript_160098/m.489679 type:complete len:205 (+) Transcript_160098:411-1025(+)